MHRTPIRWLVLLASLLLLVAACAEEEADAPDEEAAADTPADELEGELEVWAWNVAAGSLDDLSEEFEEEYPGVEVDVRDIGRLDVYDRLTVGLEAGEGLPDVVAIETDRIATFVNAHPDGFVDLAEYGAAELEDDFDPAMWAEVEGPGGEVFAMPWDSGPAGVFYRTDYFEEAGVDADAIETWDDFAEAGEQIRDEVGVDMLSVDMPGDDAEFRMLTQQQGGFYFDEDGDVAVTSDEAVRTMETLQDMADRDIVSNDADWDGLVSATSGGDIATVPFGVWWTGTLEDEVPDQSGDWGVFELPAFEEGGNRASNLGGSNLAVVADTDYPEAGYRFAEFTMADAENQAFGLDEWGLFPGYLPAFDEPVFSEPREYFGDDAIYETFAETVEDIPPVNYTEDFAEAQEIMIDAQADILLEGADPAERLQEAAELISNQTGRQIAE